MRLSDIPARLHLTQASIAALVSMDKGNFGRYFRPNSSRGKKSEVVERVCQTLDIEREEVFFQPVWDAPVEEPWHRHLSAAIECLEMAALAGADRAEVERLKELIFRFGAQTLPDSEEEIAGEFADPDGEEITSFQVIWKDPEE